MQQSTTTKQTNPKILERWEAKIERIPEAGCWIWTGDVDVYGYGRKGGDERKVHRWMWGRYKGEIPEGKYVLHHCDVPSCCNPEHLYLGTQFDNMRDMVSRGRQCKVGGERNPKARLKEAQVLEIREKSISGVPRKTLAVEYGVSISLIHQIVNRGIWTHL